MHVCNIRESVQSMILINLGVSYAKGNGYDITIEYAAI